MEERIIKDINNLLTQLFQKMHEEGYMWDSESKQLLTLKAEPSVEQKHAWSEEDESLRLRTIGALITYKIGSPTKCVDEQINWLKSLKERYTWKPSDEQMNNK